MKVLVIDNYDSFTFNLVHYLEKIVDEVEVFRNDEIQWQRVNDFDKVILSPGPGLPSESGNLMLFIEKFKFTKPILGVCLGHQALAESFGGTLYNLDHPYHGKSIELRAKINSLLYSNLPEKFHVGLYHSWAINEEGLPNEFSITSTWNGIVMSIEHKTLPLVGVQYHPESILSTEGMKILENFVNNF